MDGMGKHATLTYSQQALLAGFLAFGAVLMPLSFVVMFLTVNTLLASAMDGWAWAVPIGTEAGFIGLFFADLLLESKRRPAVLLHLAPYAFAVVSLWLNAAAAHGDVTAMVGHSVLPMVFFGYLLAAKLLARRLSVSDADRRRQVATRDAIAHARDILRAADFWWRLRAPVLLRRQIRSRRLPAAVAGAIDEGAAKWQPAVEQWITRSLVLPEGVSAQLTAARAEAAQVTPAATPEVTPMAPVQATPELASGQGEVTVPVTSRARPQRKVGAIPRVIPDADLKKLVLSEFGKNPAVSVNAAAKALGRSRDRIRPLLEEVRREANVQPIEGRRRA